MQAEYPGLSNQDIQISSIIVKHMRFRIPVFFSFPRMGMTTLAQLVAGGIREISFSSVQHFDKAGWIG
jgi:hypothetical protein